MVAICLRCNRRSDMCNGANSAARAEQEPFSISGRVTEAVSGSDIIVAGKSVHLEGTRAPNRGRICLRNGESGDIGTEVALGFARKTWGTRLPCRYMPTTADGSWGAGPLKAET
jgi:hypothetical protein